MERACSVDVVNLETLDVGGIQKGRSHRREFVWASPADECTRTERFDGKDCLRGGF